MTISYGHNVELEYLMHQAMTAVGNGDASYLAIYRRLLDHAVENGVDWEYGGIYRDGLRATGKAIDAKIGNPWKVAYHTGRSMLECREHLLRLLES
jgi:mannose/cellobiose epimerase-like protein (N-acyl-D-glucosamine 2-epimerase family)